MTNVNSKLGLGLRWADIKILRSHKNLFLPYLMAIERTGSHLLVHEMLLKTGHLMIV
jgi:hypothetical protein